MTILHEQGLTLVAPQQDAHYYLESWQRQVFDAYLLNHNFEINQGLAWLNFDEEELD